MRKIAVALTTLAFLASAQPAQAASVLVFTQSCNGNVSPNNPTNPPIRATITRFDRINADDHVYIDVEATTSVPLNSVRLNGKPAKFRYISPAPKAGGTNSPNVVNSAWRGSVVVTWVDNRPANQRLANSYTCTINNIGTR